MGMKKGGKNCKRKSVILFLRKGVKTAKIKLRRGLKTAKF